MIKNVFTSAAYFVILGGVTAVVASAENISKTHGRLTENSFNLERVIVNEISYPLSGYHPTPMFIQCLEYPLEMLEHPCPEEELKLLKTELSVGDDITCYPDEILEEDIPQTYECFIEKSHKSLNALVVELGLGLPNGDEYSKEFNKARVLGRGIHNEGFQDYLMSEETNKEVRRNYFNE